MATLLLDSLKVIQQNMNTESRQFWIQSKDQRGKKCACFCVSVRVDTEGSGKNDEK